MIIEKLARNNVTAVAKLSVELWPDCNQKTQEEYYNQMIDSDKATCYLLKLENDYCGFIELRLRTDYVEGSETTLTAYIEGVYIKKENRYLWLGRELIKTAERWAWSRGLRQLASDVEIINTPGIDFHKANGFDEVNRIVCFIKDIAVGG